MLLQTFARPEVTAAGHALFAANMTGKILQFFEEMLGINYPQKKLGKLLFEPEPGPGQGPGPGVGFNLQYNWKVF